MEEERPRCRRPKSASGLPPTGKPYGGLVPMNSPSQILSTKYPILLIVTVLVLFGQTDWRRNALL